MFDQICLCFIEQAPCSPSWFLMDDTGNALSDVIRADGFWEKV